MFKIIRMFDNRGRHHSRLLHQLLITRVLTIILLLSGTIEQVRRGPWYNNIADNCAKTPRRQNIMSALLFRHPSPANPSPHYQTLEHALLFPFIYIGIRVRRDLLVDSRKGKIKKQTGQMNRLRNARV